MAPKAKATKNSSATSDPNGMFAGMIVLLIDKGFQARRLQIWKQKLVQMGAVIEKRLSKRVTHIFAMNSDTLLRQFDSDRLSRFKKRILLYQWLEDSLKSGEKQSEDIYVLKLDPQDEYKPANGSNSSDDERLQNMNINHLRNFNSL